MKTKRFLGMAAAFVMIAGSAIGVFAAEDGYSFNIGKEKVEQGGFARDEQAEDDSGYSYRKGAGRVRDGHLTENAEERLAAGEITQEEYDAIKAEAKAKHEQISARYDGVSEMSPAERHTHFSRYQEDEDVDTKGDSTPL